MANRTNTRKAYDVYEDIRSCGNYDSEEDIIKVFCQSIDYSMNRAMAKQEELKNEILFWQNKYKESKENETLHNDDLTIEQLRYVIEDLTLTIRALVGDRPSQE